MFSLFQLNNSKMLFDGYMSSSKFYNFLKCFLHVVYVTAARFEATTE